MKIVLASASAVKFSACKKAFETFKDVEIISIKVPSGVGEQPMEGETLTGAFNRISAAQILVPDADLYVSIENGIFNENEHFIDRAVIAISKKNQSPELTYSGGVEFPVEAVAEAQRRGFDQWTVGKVMEEMGIVREHDDPHLDLSGKSRIDYIDETLRAAVKKLGLMP